FRNKAIGRRHRRCKTCVAAYGKVHYAANRTTYVVRNNLRSRAHTLVLKQKVWEYLLAHPCVDCGIADPVVLEFDHDDPAAKRNTICGECFTAYRREHYRLNRQDYIARNARLLRERGKRWCQRLWAYLAANPCVDCGEGNPIVLEFDHEDPSSKRAVVGSLARGG